LLVLLSAAGFGMQGTLSRVAYEDGMGPLAFLTWRQGVGTLVLIAIVAFLMRGHRVRLPRWSAIPRRSRATLIVVGTFNAIVNVAMFVAFTRTTIGIAMIAFYIYPIIVAIAAVRLFGERIDGRRAGAMALGFAGLGLVLAPSIMAAGPSADGLGVFLALFAAVLQALIVLLLARGVSHVPLVGISLAINAIPAVIFIGMAVVIGATPMPYGLETPRVALLAVFAGIAGCAIPSLANLRGIALLGGPRTAILMIFEAVVAVVIAALLLGERLGPVQLFGGFLVLASAAVVQLPVRGRAAVIEAVHPSV
jgi:drug/metabolite transporter (DMT)-like permease